MNQDINFNSFIRRSTENNDDNLLNLELLKSYSQYVYNHVGIYYHHYNNEEQTLWFCSTLTSEPNTWIKKNSKNLSSGKHLIYSFENLESIKECDFNSIQNELREKLSDIYADHRKGEWDQKKFIIYANEGTGKSIAVLDTISKGCIYSAPDKQILAEKEKYLDSIHKEYVRFHSNADIIYTMIYLSRGENGIAEREAKKIAMDYVQSCQNVESTLNTKKISDFLREYKEKTKIEELERFISNISENEIQKLESDTKEENTVSLVAFLAECEDISEIEKQAILDYYNYLVSRIFHGDIVITCTTHKLKILMQKMNYNRRIMVYCDEIVPDVHGSASIVSPKDKNYGNIFKFATFSELSPLKSFDNPILQKIRKSRGIKDWTLLTSYKNKFKGGGGFSSIIELKDKNWLTTNKMTLVILSTEDKCRLIYPNAEIIDKRHFIKSDNVIFLSIDGLNKTTTGKYFQGTSRSLIVKACAEKILGVKEENYIADGIGHSLENNKWNLLNIKGTNHFKSQLEKNKNITSNIGVEIKNLHPEYINFFKGLVCSATYNKIKESGQSFDSIVDQFEDEIVSIVGSDQLQQALGRLNGYRKINDTNKTYVMINSNMLKKIKTFYYTENVLTITRLSNSKDLRTKFPKEYQFLDTIHKVLNLKSKNDIEEDNTMECLNSMEIKILVDYLTGKVKSINKNIDFAGIFKKLNRLLISFIKIVREKINKIRFTPKLIENLIQFANHKSYIRNITQNLKQSIVKLLHTNLEEYFYINKINELCEI
jgi:hypothetical protein